MAARRKGKFALAIHNHDINKVRRLLCTRKIPVNAGASYREPFIIECFKVNYRQVRMTCRKEDEPKILEMLKLLVQHGADVNVRGLRCSPRRMTAAMIAADQGLERCLRFLVESGADLTITADSGDNTLMMAARAGQVDCVKYLTEHSVSLLLFSRGNKEGDNALMVAARAGQVDCVKYLTEHSESRSLFNQVNKHGDNVLMMAARAGQVDCVKYLTEHSESGSLLNRVNIEGHNALMVAARAGQVDCVKYLIEHSVSESSLNQVNKAGGYALMVAAEAGQVDCVKYLTEHSELGSLLNRVNIEGHNALMVAARAGQVDCVKYLIEHSVSESSLNQVNKEGHTALMMAASRFTDKHGLSVKCLVEAAADLNVQDRDGRTALMLAVDRRSSFLDFIWNKDIELHNTTSVQSLIKGEANLRLQDNEGRNALMIAIERNLPIAILKLLTESMSVSTLNQVNKEGQTALMMAASSSDYQNCICLLIEAGADLNVADTKTGYTALMCAIHKRNYMAATLLLEKGALVNTVSRDLETPLSLIRSDKGMITRLLSRGLDPALSCRDQGILHAMVAEGEDSVVRSLVMNGFPPVDIKSYVSRRGFGSYITVSPLALALTYKHHNIARYLILNHFFTRYDSVHLCRNQKLRQSLQLQIGQSREGTRFARARNCLGILDFLSARPLSLRDLCLVTISSALSQYLVRDPQDIPPGDSRWMCQPTFKKRVELLAIPPALKRELLHETSYSCIPCESWGDISLEEEM